MRAPGGVRDDGLRALARPQAVRDHLASEMERCFRHPRGSGLVAGREQRVVGHAHRGEVQHRFEVERQAGATWMIPAGGGDEEDVGTAPKSSNHAFEDRPLAQRSGRCGR